MLKICRCECVWVGKLSVRCAIIKWLFVLTWLLIPVTAWWWCVYVFANTLYVPARSTHTMSILRGRTHTFLWIMRHTTTECSWTFSVIICRQWRIHNFIMGGRTVEGEGSMEGLCFSPEKNWIFTWKWWVLVHSRITFYVYAKIGQANGGRPPPLDPPLSVESVLAIFSAS